MNRLRWRHVSRIHWQLLLHPVNACKVLAIGLPTVLLAGGAFGGFLGGLLIFTSLISMLEIKFLVRWFSKDKEQDMKIKFSLKSKCDGARFLGVKGNRSLKKLRRSL